MSAEQGLLSDICESPEDDTPRLVYADWLEEHDQPERAEFIRVQIELARLSRDDPRRPDLALRERELLTAHEAQWLGPLAKMISTPQFRRGFVEQVSVGVRQFMDNADEIFRLAPVCHLKLLRLSQKTPGSPFAGASLDDVAFADGKMRRKDGREMRLADVMRAGNVDRIEKEARGLESEPSANAFRYAYWIWKDPWMTVSDDTYVADLLRFAGGANVFGDEPARYPATTPQDALARGPQVHFFPSEPYPFKEEKHATSARELFGTGVKHLFVDGDDYCWHGYRTLEGLRAMRRLRETAR